MELENLYVQLQEIGLPAELQSLQNPTEEFMVYFITEYLKKFNFDGNEISKSTEEQLECLSCPDSASEAIKIINLFSALSSICNEIFLQEFCLTDISSPSPKRARRHLKILFNFLVYYNNKLAENEAAFLDLDNQQQALEEIFDKKESTIAKIGESIHNRENKLELKQKFRQEIDAIGHEMEINNKRSRELEKRVKDVMLQHQEAHKKCTDLKSKAVKLHKETTELQSKIVKSPEEYATRSKELQNLLEIKKEERQVLTDSISRKKMQIKNNEIAQELVKNLNDNFSKNSNEIFKQLKDTSEKLDYVQKELDMLKKDIAKWLTIEKNNSSNTSNDEDFKGHHEHLLLELENQYQNKEREFYSLKNHLKELNMELCKKKTMIDEEMKTIAFNQEKNVIISKEYKEYLKYQIAAEDSIRLEVSKTLA